MPVSQWNEVSAREKLAPFSDKPGGLLPAMHALQSCFGAIDKRAVDLLADIFNLSRAEVHGVISFYHDFRSEPPTFANQALRRKQPAPTLP